MSGCGISTINLEGLIQDWDNIKTKLEFLTKKGFEWYTKHLIPIIDKIIESKNYYNSNGKLNNELIEFWKRMIR